MSHYHIRWSGKAEFDWKRHGSRGDAEESAELLVRRAETYTVEEVHDESCPMLPCYLENSEWRRRGNRRKPQVYGKKPWPMPSPKFAQSSSYRVNVAQRTVSNEVYDQGPAHNEEKGCPPGSVEEPQSTIPGRG